MIKWIYKPAGIAPVQAEGYFWDCYFYFRGRHSTIRIEFAPTKEDCWADKNVTTYKLKETTGDSEASCYPYWKCTLLIYWGCWLYVWHKKILKK